MGTRSRRRRSRRGPRPGCGRRRLAAARVRSAGSRPRHYEPMRIRPATDGDVSTIAAIVAECDGVAAPTEYELRKASEAVTSSTRRTLIAEIDGEPAGYVSVDRADPDRAHLSRLFVRPAYWGSGVAKALHDEAVALGGGAMSLTTP